MNLVAKSPDPASSNKELDTVAVGTVGITSIHVALTIDPTIDSSCIGAARE